jgi:hypothetical protein
LYYTNDITAASPVWYRFQNGLPNAMIWDMQIDRGSTTLSVWTRGRGAYVWPLPSAPLPTLTKVVSRKIHGPGTTFYDVDLTPPILGIECRSGGDNGDYSMVFTFSNSVASCGLPSQGTASQGPDANQCTVQLTGVPNAQYTTVELQGVIDTFGNSVDGSGLMGLLIGDTNEDHSVNSGDISQVKSQSGIVLSSSNAREDLNTDGDLNSGDISLVKSKSGTALP